MTNLLAQMQNEESKKDNKDDDSSGQRIKDTTKNSLEKKETNFTGRKVQRYGGRKLSWDERSANSPDTR